MRHRIITLFNGCIEVFSNTFSRREFCYNISPKINASSYPSPTWDKTYRSHSCINDI